MLNISINGKDWKDMSVAQKISFFVLSFLAAAIAAIAGIVILSMMAPAVYAVIALLLLGSDGLFFALIVVLAGFIVLMLGTFLLLLLFLPVVLAYKMIVFICKAV